MKSAESNQIKEIVRTIQDCFNSTVEPSLEKLKLFCENTDKDRYGIICDGAIDCQNFSYTKAVNRIDELKQQNKQHITLFLTVSESVKQ